MPALTYRCTGTSFKSPELLNVQWKSTGGGLESTSHRKVTVSCFSAPNSSSRSSRHTGASGRKKTYQGKMSACWVEWLYSGQGVETLRGGDISKGLTWALRQFQTHFKPFPNDFYITGVAWSENLWGQQYIFTRLRYPNREATFSSGLRGGKHWNAFVINMDDFISSSLYDIDKRYTRWWIQERGRQRGNCLMFHGFPRT